MSKVTGVHQLVLRRRVKGSIEDAQVYAHHDAKLVIGNAEYCLKWALYLRNIFPNLTYVVKCLIITPNGTQTKDTKL